MALSTVLSFSICTAGHLNEPNWNISPLRVSFQAFSSFSRWMVASVISVSARAISSTPMWSSTAPMAVRSSSRRRSARTARRAYFVVVCRVWIALASSSSAAQPRGRSASALSSQATDSGIHSISSPT